MVALLFAIFWMGTLSVFDREIDRWMMLDTRLALPAAPASFDAVAARAGEIVPAGAEWWFLLSPSEREEPRHALPRRRQRRGAA